MSCRLSETTGLLHMLMCVCVYVCVRVCVHARARVSVRACVMRYPSPCRLSARRLQVSSRGKCSHGVFFLCDFTLLCICLQYLGIITHSFWVIWHCYISGIATHLSLVIWNCYIFFLSDLAWLYIWHCYIVGTAAAYSLRMPARSHLLPSVE